MLLQIRQWIIYQINEVGEGFQRCIPDYLINVIGTFPKYLGVTLKEEQVVKERGINAVFECKHGLK